MSKKKNKERRMSTATIDPTVVEMTEETPVEQNLVGTPQPIDSQEAAMAAFLAAEELVENTNIFALGYDERDDDPEIIDAATNHDQDEDPIESYTDPIEQPPLDEPVPTQEEETLAVASPAVATPEPTKADLIAMIARIQSELEKLRSGASIATTTNGTATKPRQIASGSKARPNVIYTLLAKPNSWHGTPQVAQLQGLLFDPIVATKYRKDDGSVQLTEPELFEIIEAGKAEGKLRTKQPAVRIFQYYRNELLHSNTLRWS